MNVFAVMVLACVPIGLIRYATTGRSIDWAGATGKPGIAIATFVVAFFVLRNIPFVPFTYLAPIELSEYDKAPRTTTVGKVQPPLYVVDAIVR